MSLLTSVITTMQNFRITTYGIKYDTTYIFMKYEVYSAVKIFFIKLVCIKTQ